MTEALEMQPQCDRSPVNRCAVDCLPIRRILQTVQTDLRQVLRSVNERDAAGLRVLTLLIFAAAICVFFARPHGADAGDVGDLPGQTRSTFSATRQSGLQKLPLSD